MQKNSDFSIQLSSDLDYEGMIIEICFENQIIATVNYEKGIEQIEIELYPENNNKSVFKINQLMKILEKARKLAIQCANEDKKRK